MTNNNNNNTSIYESIHQFLLLPSHIPIILLLEFLNSFRSFGLRFVLYNYITNEFGLSDTSAGLILGIKSFIDIGFGLMGSILVDIWGVRRVSLMALSVALVGRTLLAFGRSTTILYVALFVFSPCGDALLSVGLYRVALKKLTTPRTRPLAFGLSYAFQNASGAVVALVVDRMRRRLDDVHVNIGSGDGGKYVMVAAVEGVYTPVRQFIILTWFVLFITFIVAYRFLEDWSVFDPDDLDEEYRNSDSNDQAINRTRRRRIKKKHSNLCDEGSDSQSSSDDSVQQCDASDRHVNHNAHYLRSIPLDNAIPAKPMVGQGILHRWFPNSYQPIIQHHQHRHSAQEEGDSVERRMQPVSSRRQLVPHYKMYRTQHRKTTSDEGGRRGCCGTSATSPCSSALQILKQFIFILQMRNTWKVLIFSFASVPVVLQWTASEIVLPPFLERRYGESIPIYTIQSIHMIGCLIFPPFAQAFTSALEDFRVVMPGLWIMAISPVFVAMLPNVLGACIWQLFMTAGQVLWSPRQDSWTAGLAPTGMEGLFFAVGSSRALLAPLGDFAMGMMNERYNANCPECRDSYGHFCSHLVDTSEEGGDSALQCSSVQESCNIFLDSMQQACPTTCTECPSWEPTNPSTFWYILVVTSITSPFLAWIFLPFLRGRHTRKDRWYGVCSVSISRFLGICGVPEDQHSCQMYGQIIDDDESDSDLNLEAKSCDISFVREHDT